MAGAASALFLLDIKGRVLIWRDYRGDVSAAQAERFFTKFIEKEVKSFCLSLPSASIEIHAWIDFEMESSTQLLRLVLAEID